MSMNGPNKQLLVVTHAPSPNLAQLRDAVLKGANSPAIDGVEVVAKTPFEATPDDVRAAHGIILGTPENLGYMSGALKDFFDRIYYACLDETQGLPYALYIRGLHDGTGARRGVETIVTGLRWRAIHDPIICRGEFDQRFVTQCGELGTLMAAGLEAGIF